MSTEFFERDLTGTSTIEIHEAPGFPPPRHPAEADLFARHADIPGHNQEVFESAQVCVVGGGGLAGWSAMSLLRTGLRNLTIIDFDSFDRTNANRQLMFGCDVGVPKAIALAKNLVPHMVAGGTITSMAMPFAEATTEFALSADLLLVLVDNNRCRADAVRFARSRRIPAIFSMLSADSMRVHTFLQDAAPTSACLWCALPNLLVDSAMPCVSATMAGCFASAAQVSFFAYRALMGWPENAEVFNWIAADLFGTAADHRGLVARRLDCPVCAATNE